MQQQVDSVQNELNVLKERPKEKQHKKAHNKKEKNGNQCVDCKQWNVAGFGCKAHIFLQAITGDFEASCDKCDKSISFRNGYSSDKIYNGCLSHLHRFQDSDDRDHQPQYHYYDNDYDDDWDD